MFFLKPQNESERIPNPNLPKNHQEKMEILQLNLNAALLNDKNTGISIWRYSTKRCKGTPKDETKLTQILTTELW